jgi:hypothetical protein
MGKCSDDNTDYCEYRFHLTERKPFSSMENDLEDFMKNRERFWTRLANVGEPTPYRRKFPTGCEDYTERTRCLPTRGRRPRIAA